MTVKSAVVDVGGTLWPEQPTDDGIAVYRRRLQHSLPDVDEATVDLLLEELGARDPAATGLPTTQNTTAIVEQSVLAAGLNRDLAPAVLLAMQVPARELLNPFPESRDFLARLKEKEPLLGFGRSVWRSKLLHRASLMLKPLQPH